MPLLKCTHNYWSNPCNYNLMSRLEKEHFKDVKLSLLPIKVGYLIVYHIVGCLCYFLMGRFLGGLFLKCSRRRLITSDIGLECSSLSFSRKEWMSSVVLNPMNFERFCFISLTMLNIYILIIKDNNVNLC